MKRIVLMIMMMALCSIASAQLTKPSSSTGSGDAGPKMDSTRVNALIAALKGDTTNQIRKYTILMQAGLGTDSALITTSYRIPMGHSTGFYLDTLIIYQLRTGNSTPCVKYRILFGMDPSGTGTMVDTTTAISYTTATIQTGANIEGTRSIPAGAAVWIDFPTVTIAPKTFLVVLIGHKL